MKQRPFLTWDNQQQAEEALASVNAVYGCPYIAPNGYRMDQWASVIKANVGEEWGFVRPVPHLEKTEYNLISSMAPHFTEWDSKPERFITESNEV